MKTKLPSQQQAIDKIYSTIQSCITMDQFTSAGNLLIIYKKMFPINSYSSLEKYMNIGDYYQEKFKDYPLQKHSCFNRNGCLHDFKPCKHPALFEFDRCSKCGNIR